jgi:choline dehydrogenase
LTDNQTYATEQLDLYNSKRQGPYTITNEAGNTVAFLPLPNITSDYQSIIDMANSQSLTSIYPSSSDSTIQSGYSAQRSIILRLYSSMTSSVQETGWNGGSGLPITLVKPLSRGTILINSTDILDSPMIDWASLSDPTDLETLLAALKINRKMIASSPMQELKPVELAPGANLTSDDDLRTALRQQVQPTYSHPCCTSPMMKQEFGGVVDANLTVYGVEGLSIVDASIFPLIPATHLSATVYAVAEKVSCLPLLIDSSMLTMLGYRLRMSSKLATIFLK